MDGAACRAQNVGFLNRRAAKQSRREPHLLFRWFLNATADFVVGGACRRVRVSALDPACDFLRGTLAARRLACVSERRHAAGSGVIGASPEDELAATNAFDRGRAIRAVDEQHKIGLYVLCAAARPAND